jgi:hypothetical protein
MDSAKIRLSAKEMELINNADWILTKNDILKKTVLLLAQLQSLQEKHIKGNTYSALHEWQVASPKIAKGENYLGLPYRLLDYPAIFNKEHIAAIRTFFWWGKCFSVTLQLSGIYKNHFQEKLIQAIPLLQANEVYICVNEDPWQHHFEEENYKQLNIYSANMAASIIGNASFTKLAIKLPIEIWYNPEEPLLGAFKLFTKIMED